MASLTFSLAACLTPSTTSLLLSSAKIKCQALRSSPSLPAGPCAHHGWSRLRLEESTIGHANVPKVVNQSCSRRRQVSCSAKGKSSNFEVIELQEAGALIEVEAPKPREAQDESVWAAWVAGAAQSVKARAKRALATSVAPPPRTPRNVVVTGSTRGLGKALAREFLRGGDNVVVASRSEEAVARTVAELQAELAAAAAAAQDNRSPPLAVLFRKAGGGDSGSIDDGDAHLRVVSTTLGDQQEEVEGSSKRGQKIVGMACDVCSAVDVHALAAKASLELHSIDIWINNAGTTTGAKPFLEFSDEELNQVVQTNLMGSLVCTREAIRVMSKQPRGGHVFNMDGAGSGGSATPRYAAYGATKCALRQLHATLVDECKKTNVGIHTASPGMVLTDLLLSGATLENKQVFNIVCEQPETVARALVPRIRAVKGTGAAVNYLTPPRIGLALVTAWLRRGRWFDEQGRAVYAAEADRLRIWAEGRQQSPISAAMELPGSMWFSLVSSSVICAYIILVAANSNSPPGF